jgi:hypothetical protein
MSYDLYAWPVDRAMSDDEARVEIEGRMGRWSIGLGRDRRLAPFVQAIERRFPGLGTPHAAFPMEFDVHRDWVFMALPWSFVAEMIEAIAPIAFAEGLALYDPQRDVVALPSPFGASPLGTAGTEEHERKAEQAFDLIRQGASIGPDGELPDVVDELTRAAEIKVMSPLGFEITPDIAGEVQADPTRVPGALQTPDRKEELIRQVAEERASVRHHALAMLGGWDPDPDVRAALRPLLEDDDVHVVGLAAQALARQGSTTDLPALLAAVHRMSPADGGTLDSMLFPLMAALDLAHRAGPDAVADVKAKARAWRVSPRPGGRQETLMEAELDRLLGP